MHKFKEGKGRAFSYFSIVAKNYLILNNNKNYKMGKIHSQMDVLDYKRNTQHITRIINVMKKYNKRLIHEFDTHGMVDISHTGSIVNE
jgi:hypothetical protein